MIDNDPARFGAGVGIALARQAGDDPALGRDDIDRSSGIAGRHPHLGRRDRRGFFGRLGRQPVDGGRRQDEAAARGDLYDGDRRGLAFDHILQHRLVIALGPKQGLGGRGGLPRPASGLEPVGGRLVRLSDGANDLVAQGAVHVAANLGARFGDGGHGAGRPQAEGGDQG